MKFRLKIFPLCILLLLNIVGYGQDAKLRQADKYYEAYSFVKAIELYEGIPDKKAETLRKLANAYKNTGNFSKAESTYALVVTTDEVVDDDFYNYAMLLRTNDHYDQSEIWMEKYIQNHTEDGRGKEFHEKEKMIRNMADNNKFVVTNLAWNSMHQEYGLMQYGGKVCFVSSNQGVKVVKHNWNWNQLPFLDVLMAEINPNYELEKVQRIDIPINSRLHEGRVTISEDGNYVIFSRNVDSKDNKNLVLVQLFSLEKTDGKWSKPRKLEFCQPGYSYSNPFLTTDGKTLLFASNMKGGKGGADIYKSTKNVDGSWSQPMNLGDYVNSEGNEVFPYLDTQRNLYFSSDGHTGLGGLDIFKCSPNGSGYNESENMGIPINSRWDDFGLIHFSDDKHGYFASNREGGEGNDDIYSFSEQIPIEFRQFSIEGTILNGENQAFPNVHVEVVDENGDILEPMLDSTRSDANGKYNFRIKDEKDPEDMDVESQFWVVVKHGEIYDSKSPEAIDAEKGQYKVDFVVDVNPDVLISLDIKDELAGASLEDVKITMIDNETDTRRVIIPDSSKLKIGVPGKKAGDKLDYEFYIEKVGYQTQKFSYETQLDTQGTYEVERHIRKKVFKDVIFTGMCRNTDGEVLKGVSIDLMDGDAETFGTTQTDDNGEYYFKLSVEVKEEQPLDIESDFWLFAKYKDRYDSKNPGQDLKEEGVYKTNFIFEKPSGVVLTIEIKDAENEQFLDGADLILIDNFTSKKKQIRVENGLYSFNLKDKRKGDKVSFKWSLTKENYRPATSTFEALVDDSGLLIISAKMEKKVFREIEFSGIVKTPQGNRLKGVEIDLMDDEMEFLGSAKTDNDGAFDFTARAEVIPDKPLHIHEEFWLFAKYKEFYESQNPMESGQGEWTYFNTFVFDEKPDLAINLDISDETKNVAMDKVKITVTDNVTHDSVVIVPERSNLKIGLKDKKIGDEVDYSIRLQKEGYQDKVVHYNQKLDTVGVYVIEESIEKKKFEDIVIHGIARDNNGIFLPNVEIDVMNEEAEFVSKSLTDKEGKYEVKLRLNYKDGVPPSVEKDYWLFAKYRTFYDSKNPVADLARTNEFEANFLFKTKPEISLELILQDSVTKMLLNECHITIVDESTSEKRMVQATDGRVVLPISDKNVGDSVHYQFKIEKTGYYTQWFGYKKALDKEGVYELKKVLRKVDRNEIVISGICHNNKGEPLKGVGLDLMDLDMEFEGSVITGPDGTYTFSVHHLGDIENDFIISDRYWIMAKYKDLYDSKNPVAFSGDLKKYQANFVFNEDTDFSLILDVRDEGTGEKLDQVDLIIIDNFTSKKKHLSVQNGSYVYHLTDKKLGEPISFKIQLEKEHYRTKAFTYETMLDSIGLRKVSETLARKEFKELTFLGIVKTPQGERLKGVRMELMDDAGDFVGSTETNSEGAYKFSSMVEVIPGQELNVEDSYWLFAKYKEFYDSKNPLKMNDKNNHYYNEYIFDEQPEISFNLDISEETKNVALSKVKITVTNNDTHDSIVFVPERSFLKIGLKDRHVGDSVNYNISFEKEGFAKKEVHFNQKLDTAGIYVIKESIEKKKSEEVTIYGQAMDNDGNALSGVEIDVMDAEANFVTKCITNEQGKYSTKLIIDLTKGAMPRIERDYWLFAKYKTFYDSKNPVADLSKGMMFEANFMFREHPDLSLELTVHESGSVERLSDFSVAITDQWTGERRVFQSGSELAKIGLPDKKVGDHAEYKIEIEKEGYEQLTFNYKITLDRDGVFKINRALKVMDRKEVAVQEPRVVELDLNTIYFEYDSYKLTPEAKTTLVRNEKSLLGFSSVILWVSGYTDARGNTEYNMELSRKRMLAVIDWFNARPVGKKIIYKVSFFGESKLANGCREDAECTEEEHALNRRVEMKMKGE